jgi:hypothetical protein
MPSTSPREKTKIYYKQWRYYRWSSRGCSCFANTHTHTHEPVLWFVRNNTFSSKSGSAYTDQDGPQRVVVLSYAYVVRWQIAIMTIRVHVITSYGNESRTFTEICSVARGGGGGCKSTESRVRVNRVRQSSRRLRARVRQVRRFYDSYNCQRRFLSSHKRGAKIFCKHILIARHMRSNFKFYKLHTTMWHNIKI